MLPSSALNFKEKLHALRFGQKQVDMTEVLSMGSLY